MRPELRSKLEATARRDFAQKPPVTPVTPVTAPLVTGNNILKLQGLQALQVKNDKKRNDANRPVILAVTAPPESDFAELEERRAMAMASIPEPYLDAWARLQCQKPVRVSDADWRQAIDDAGRFLDQWGSLAVEFQWTPADLFDVPRDGSTGGLAWLLNGEAVRALGPEYAVTDRERVFNRTTRAEWINPCQKGK